MRRTAAGLLIAVGSSLPFLLAPLAWAQINMVISRHVGVTISEQRADQIFADAHALLLKKDGTDDVSCDVDFRRSGPVSSFDGIGAINDTSDFAEVCAERGNVHVVREINWCMVPGDFHGCASTSANCMVVVRDFESLEGILWAHEYGHTQGLHHRNNANALMYPALWDTNRRVLAWECDYFPYASPSATPASSPPVDNNSPTPSAPTDIEAFVRHIYIHGVPYELATKYPQEVVPTLLKMLKDPKEARHRANIITTLCIVGRNAGIAGEAIGVFERGEGKLSASEYRAKKAALLGLGYLANSGDKTALEYLEKSVDSDAWDRRGLKWQSPFDDSPAYRNAQLTTLAVWGLVISGQPEAHQILEFLEAIGKKKGASVLSAHALPPSLIANALQDYEAVRAEGLLSYEKRGENF